MNRFKQHIPCYVDIKNHPDWIEFDSTEELLNLEIVKRYGNEENFSHFAIDGNCLMEISDEGFYWWVIGYIEKPELVSLPKWDGGKYRAELKNGDHVVLIDDDVVLICGDILKLKDGSIAKSIDKQSFKKPI